ncbi:glutathione-dependent formaldehyde-activating [Cavenderia fasciculata]|uniref:Glutathione-dependent formaldehyde-activating n=1 Tax=Cavenderia fasciculata TaxID=261658 RepID=F4PZG8_CACFS|nr:glutathione-dependent formaldehyde-activating [Cavenderia fasciculata]EGG19197.1 glutathione-dependent formaldehyde-activating [Cavenderia fasciculata]|eukprot:XP_004366830.1 glutathione-dependent formaldehyde-activating [Cavenderia fasciculata]
MSETSCEVGPTTHNASLFKEGRQAYHGSCHCGALKYSVEIDFLTNKSVRCNCSFCTKIRIWEVLVKPEFFKLLEGQDSYTTYKFGEKAHSHYHCKHCGIRCHGFSIIPDMGGDFIAISINTLDDLTDEQMSSLIVQPLDGRNNNWFEVPKFHNHL